MQVGEKDIQELEPVADDVKKLFLENQNEYELIRSEILNCCRQIKMWLAVSQAKEKYKRFNHESFWGWSQHSYFKLIAIDGYKIFKHTKEYIVSVLKEVISAEQIEELIQHSRLKERISKLGKCVLPLKDYRNKRYVHIEKYELAVVTCNLNELFNALANLYNSLGYISHYLSNPQFIAGKEWSNHFTVHNIEDKLSSSYLDSYLRNDPSIKDCLEVIKKLNQ